MNIEVRTVAGKVIGTFQLDASAAVLELKHLIAESNGPLPELQKLVCGEMILSDDERIEKFSAASSDSQLRITLAIPNLEIDPGSQIEVRWQSEDGSDGLLENLIFHNSSDDEQEWKYHNPGWTMSPMSSYDNSGVLCVGMDPDSGLLLMTHGDDDGRSVSRALLLPSVGLGYEVPVDCLDPLGRAFEIHVMQEKSFSAPVGVAVALVWKEIQVSETIIIIIFGPRLFKTSALCHDADVRIEAMCLARSVFPLRAICAERQAEGKHHVNIRQHPDKVEDLFSIPGNSERITSIAWVAAKASSWVLFTVAGSHTLSIYRNTGEGWQSVAVVGGSRRCQDGPLYQCLFCTLLRWSSHPSPLFMCGVTVRKAAGLISLLSRECCSISHLSFLS
eukprot:gnl/MRDRNA2_/MRDRNA2_82797_c0_seq3.p1 gnl/MRDRNA2_/MRDRNA2_82797_c0~~gnl/MRDRNA2_/MRDRNA2_82797_c0_seq3.p1  ORF type:complete len:390 (-),score=62.00 gnl/MRDRNA2_/MRDRNA2_82797_c0_seq3:112-1281(-)